eukprot:2540895-Amphidinium_carterae.1
MEKVQMFNHPGTLWTSLIQCYAIMDENRIEYLSISPVLSTIQKGCLKLGNAQTFNPVLIGNWGNDQTFNLVRCGSVMSKESQTEWNI